MDKTPERAPIKNEQRSELWKIPPFPGHQGEAPRQTMRNQHQSVYESQKRRSGPGSNTPGPHSSHWNNASSAHRYGPSMMPVVDHAYPAAAWTTLPHAPKASATTPAMPFERHRHDHKPNPAQLPASHSYGVQSPAPHVSDSYRPSANSLLNLDRSGRCLRPTWDNAETRMRCLYPGFKRPIKGADSAPPRQTEREARAAGSPLARDAHVKKVWSIVSWVMNELRDKSYRDPTRKLDVNCDSELGAYVVNLMMMHKANREHASNASSADGSRAQGTGSSDSRNRHVGFPSHEEMLAYKILSMAFEFPGWMADTVIGTEFEYLLYPMPPNTPVVDPRAALDVEQKLVELAAKTKQADADLKRQQNELAAKTKQADADLQRKQEEFAARKKRAKVKAKQQRAEMERGAHEKLEAIKARSAHVEKILPLLSLSVDKFKKLHRKKQSCSQRILNHIKMWKEEGQRMGEADTGADEPASSVVEDEQVQRPDKKRRLGK